MPGLDLSAARLYRRTGALLPEGQAHPAAAEAVLHFRGGALGGAKKPHSLSWPDLIRPSRLGTHCFCHSKHDTKLLGGGLAEFTARSRKIATGAGPSARSRSAHSSCRGPT